MKSIYDFKSKLIIGENLEKNSEFKLRKSGIIPIIILYQCRILNLHSIIAFFKKNV